MNINSHANGPGRPQAPEKMPKAGTLTGTYLCEEKAALRPVTVHHYYYYYYYYYCWY